MNPGALLARLRGGLTKNKAGLAVLGAAAVAALAWQARSSKASEPADSAGDSTLSSGGQLGTAPYDSTSSDVYNAIQPELEQIGQLLREWAPKTVPVPAPEVPVTPGTSQKLENAIKKQGAAWARVEAARREAAAAQKRLAAAKTAAARRTAQRAVEAAQRNLAIVTDQWEQAKREVAKIKASS